MTHFGDVESLLRFPYDQLHPSVEFLKKNYESDKWQETIAQIKKSGIDRIMPASENGVRNLAVRTLSELSNIPILTVPGSERELSYAQYIKYDKKPDPIKYQSLVAASKHARVSNLTTKQAKRIGVITEDDLQSRTLSIGFDTIILTWNKSAYLPLEKPNDEDEAMQTITTLVSGAPFLVSTVARVQNLMNSMKTADSATLIPVRIHVDNRFDRGDLMNKWIEIYRNIKTGKDQVWKVTPAGPSLMHPEIQKHVHVAVDGDLSRNLIPEHFTTVDYVNTSHVPYKPSTSRNIGDLAYKQFGEKIIGEVGFRSLNDLTIPTRQMVGMVFSGYSDSGMRIAMDRYARKMNSKYLENYLSYRWDARLIELLAS